MTAFVVPAVKARADADKLTRTLDYIRIAVGAAEQIFSGPGQGAEKKRYVLNYLSEKGFQIDDAAIEAAVNDLTRSVAGALTAAPDEFCPSNFARTTQKSEVDL
ncbi:MAG: phage holin family protein [Clostridiales bacterium]|nr:phage holin family protein [Clostridiales bacterium]